MYLFLIDIIAQTLFLSSFPLYFLLLSSVPSSNRCSSGYLWTHHPSASASILLGLQACATLLVCLGTTLGGTNTSTLLMHTFTHTWTHTHGHTALYTHLSILTSWKTFHTKTCMWERWISIFLKNSVESCLIELPIYFSIFEKVWKWEMIKSKILLKFLVTKLFFRR